MIAELDDPTSIAFGFLFLLAWAYFAYIDLNTPREALSKTYWRLMAMVCMAAAVCLLYPLLKRLGWFDRRGTKLE
jgi:hypothetical protein